MSFVNTPIFDQIWQIIFFLPNLTIWLSFKKWSFSFVCALFIQWSEKRAFLDASCDSVCLSYRPFVRPSVRLSVRSYMRHAFIKRGKINTLDLWMREPVVVWQKWLKSKHLGSIMLVHGLNKSGKPKKISI